MNKQKEKVPDLRFKGFTDDWEQRKLSKLTTEIGTGKSKYKLQDNGRYPILGSTSVIGYDNNFDYTGDFILTARVGANAGNLYRFAGSVKITDNTVFIKSKYNKFLYYYLQKYDLKKLSFGTGQPLVKASELKNLKILKPRLDEEIYRISKLLLSVDNLITLHQRKLVLLKQLKKGLLQKMFADKDSKRPILRFKGFDEDWVQRKLGDLGYATGGTSLESEFDENGQYKVISIGSYSEDHTYNDQGIRAVKNDRTNKRVLNKGDLTMILNDKTASGKIIGSVLIVQSDNTYIYNQRTERIEPNHQYFSSMFLYQYLNAANVRQRIIANAQGNTQIYVNWSAISKIKYYLPALKEQKQIGTALDRIDNLLICQQQEILKLNKIKKSLLQQMFI